MKSKFKDYLLYTLSTIGVVALFISATTLPPQSSTVPESHVWEIHSDGSSDARMYAINKKTGEVRKYASAMSDNVFANYIVMKQK
jgi:hypothetical protein